MSFCRTSSDDFQCDIYCYFSVGDYYQIHVAARRHTLSGPIPPSVDFSKDAKGWSARHALVMRMIEKAQLEPIGLPHDGASLQTETGNEAADILEMLRNEGYNVPQYAIDDLRADDESEG